MTTRYLKLKLDARKIMPKIAAMMTTIVVGSVCNNISYYVLI